MWYKVINIPHSGLFYIAFLLYNNSKTTESFLSILIFMLNSWITSMCERTGPLRNDRSYRAPADEKLIYGRN